MDWQARLAALEERIAAACKAAGRARGEVTLVAVSKEQPDEAVRALWALGQRDFGENKVQALMARVAVEPGPLGESPAGRPRWHLIGPIQTNKVKDIAALHGDGALALLHTVDRAELVTALAKRLDPLKPLECLIQVDVDQEPQKAGVALGDLEGLITLVRATQSLRLRGLMAIPRPLAEVGETALRKSFEALRARAREYQLEILSLGMSDDFELAIATGATHIRVGSALFGPRPDR